MKTTRKLNKKKLCMLIVAGAFLLLFAAYLITANYFNDRFLFGTIVNGKERKEENPCSLCAKMRKGALNQAIKNVGCNKVAYAHHKDDVVETMLMSLIFEGRFHTFAPVTYLDRMDLTVIRPLMYMNEVDVIGFVNKYNVPVVKSPCPEDGHTKREYVKNLLRQLNLENPGVKERMFTAIRTGNMKGWVEYLGSNKIQ